MILELPPKMQETFRRHEFDPFIRKISWRRKRQPTLYSCLNNPMDREAWWATVYGVSEEEDVKQ